MARSIDLQAAAGVIDRPPGTDASTFHQKLQQMSTLWLTSFTPCNQSILESSGPQGLLGRGFDPSAALKGLPTMTQQML